MDEFIKTLERGLSGFHPQARQEILNDYIEHFRIGLEAGKTEQQIAQSLGDPVKLAKMYAVMMASKRAHRSRGFYDTMRLIGAALSYKLGGGILTGTVYFCCLSVLVVWLGTAAAFVLGGAGGVVLLAYELAAGYAVYAALAFFTALSLVAGGLLLFKGGIRLWRLTFARLPLLTRRIMRLAQEETV